MLAFEPPGLCSPWLTQGRRGMEVKDRCVTPSVACRPVHAGELWLLRMTSVSRQLGARLGWVTGVGQALNAHPGAGPGVSALAHLPSQAPRGAGRLRPRPAFPTPALVPSASGVVRQAPPASPSALRGVAAVHPCSADRRHGPVPGPCSPHRCCWWGRGSLQFGALSLLEGGVR